jgi:hypothetical protein
MNRLRFEHEIRERGRRVAESGLIKNCMTFAEELGKGGSTSAQWASARYDLIDGPVKVHYEVYAMGDREVKVYNGEKLVFEAKERVNTQPKYPNPVIEIEGRSFELMSYVAGNWENTIARLEAKMKQQVPEEEMKDAGQRFGLAAV